MKCLNLYLIGFCCLIASSLFAQTPEAIEADLFKSFKNLDFWRYQQTFNEVIKPQVKFDSLVRANTVFAKKLEFYAKEYPVTLNYPFKSLIKYQLTILTSPDKVLRIYSWDSGTGGVSNFFGNVIQYKSGLNCKVIVDTTKELGDNRPSFLSVDTFTTNNKTYYLVKYLSINDEKDWDEGIRAYTIENGNLIDAKLMKTDSGLYANLSYKIHTDSYGKPKIRFSKKRNTIYLPLISDKHHFAHKFELYRFTGQYFERTKIRSQLLHF